MGRQRWDIEWGKLAILSVCLVFGFVLVLLALIVLPADDPRFAAALSFGTGTFGTVIGYVTGNGRLAAKNKPPEPAFRRRPDTDE